MLHAGARLEPGAIKLDTIAVAEKGEFLYTSAWRRARTPGGVLVFDAPRKGARARILYERFAIAPLTPLVDGWRFSSSGSGGGGGTYDTTKRSRCRTTDASAAAAEAMLPAGAPPKRKAPSPPELPLVDSIDALNNRALGAGDSLACFVRLTTASREANQTRSILTGTDGRVAVFSADALNAWALVANAANGESVTRIDALIEGRVASAVDEASAVVEWHNASYPDAAEPPPSLYEQYAVELSEKTRPLTLAARIGGYNVYGGTAEGSVLEWSLIASAEPGTVVASEKLYSGDAGDGAVTALALLTPGRTAIDGASETRVAVGHANGRIAVLTIRPDAAPINVKRTWAAKRVTAIAVIDNGNIVVASDEGGRVSAYDLRQDPPKPVFTDARENSDDTVYMCTDGEADTSVLYANSRGVHIWRSDKEGVQTYAQTLIKPRKDGAVPVAIAYLPALDGDTATPGMVVNYSNGIVSVRAIDGSGATRDVQHGRVSPGCLIVARNWIVMGLKEEAGGGASTEIVAHTPPPPPSSLVAKLKWWIPSLPAEQRRLPGHDATILSIVALSTGELASVDEAGWLRIWNLVDDAPVVTKAPKQLTAGCRACALAAR